jgi:hypothetical protein
MPRGLHIGFGGGRPYRLIASPGVFNLMGYDATGLASGFTLNAAPGLFSLHGDAASFSQSGIFNLAGAPGVFALHGDDATMLKSAFSLAAAPGIFALAGQAAALTADLLAPLWPDPLPAGAIGVAYSYTLTASGGVPPYAYSVTAGTLPAGLSLNADTVSGTPTTAINFDAVTFGVTDSS